MFKYESDLMYSQSANLLKHMQENPRPKQTKEEALATLKRIGLITASDIRQSLLKDNQL